MADKDPGKGPEEEGPSLELPSFGWRRKKSRKRAPAAPDAPAADEPTPAEEPTAKGPTSDEPAPAVAADLHPGDVDARLAERLVRWAAVESVQRVSSSTRVGRYRDRVGEHRGRNIGVVAAARKQIGHVYYALRDGHVRALDATVAVS